MGIDGTGFGDWTPRQESTTGQEQHREIGTIMEQEKEESNTRGRGSSRRRYTSGTRGGDKKSGSNSHEQSTGTGD